MKIQARIKEAVDMKIGTETQSVIVEFVGDKDRQPFEVLFYHLDPYRGRNKKMGYLGTHN